MSKNKQIKIYKINLENKKTNNNETRAMEAKHTHKSTKKVIFITFEKELGTIQSYRRQGGLTMLGSRRTFRFPRKN